MKPGRAVWRFLDGGQNTFEGVKGFTALGEQLGFEYHVVEGVWQRWTDEQMRAFMDDAKRRHLGTTLPFTRYLAGAGDYTPVVFGERRKDTPAEPSRQSGGRADQEPAEHLGRDDCAAGQRDRRARRRGAPPGRRWFIAVLNGPTAPSLRIDLGFLGKGRYDALIVRDKSDDPAAVIVEKTALTATMPLTADLRAAGGFIARLALSESRIPNPKSR